jgi:sugar-specific transcriptional regulator TrmB
MQHVKATLRTLGLNEKEVEIYLLLLSVGMVPASVIGKRAGIPKSTARYICGELAKKGLAVVTKKKHTYFFGPELPSKLLSQLERRKAEINAQEQSIRKVVTALESIMQPGVLVSKVQFYEGTKELVELYEKLLSLGKPIDSIEEKGELEKLFPEYAMEYTRKRIAHGIKNRCIAPEGSPLNGTDPSRLIETRFVDAERYPLCCDVKICDDHVGICAFNDSAPVGILIQHKDIAQHFRLMFEFMWNNLKPSPATDGGNDRRKGRNE